MPETKASAGAIGAAAVLCIPIILCWIAQIALLSDLGGSDAAGNAMAQGFAAIAIVILWTLLAVLAILAYLKGEMPDWAGLAAAVLIPVSGLAAMSALDLLGSSRYPPFL